MSWFRPTPEIYVRKPILLEDVEPAPSNDEDLDKNVKDAVTGLTQSVLAADRTAVSARTELAKRALMSRKRR